MNLLPVYGCVLRVYLYCNILCSGLCMTRVLFSRIGCTHIVMQHAHAVAGRIKVEIKRGEKRLQLNFQQI